MIIGVNCGHTLSGTDGNGAVGFINESDETRKVGKKVMQYLKSAGHTVVDCTNDKAESVSDNLENIVALANKQPLDLFVSIHFNAGRGKGTEVYTYGGAKHEEAVRVCRKMAQLGFNDRGVKDGSSLFVVKNTNAKALLIEVCFVDTKSDTDLYKLRGVDAVAQAIAEGVDKNLDLVKHSLADDCKVLAEAGIIDSPGYWAIGNGYSDENTILLIKKFASYVRGA